MKEKKLESEANGANRIEEDICVEVIRRVTGYVRGCGPSIFLSLEIIFLLLIFFELG